MRYFFVTVSLFILAIGQLFSQSNFEINKVIEIGPGRGAKWSPSGRCIAYLYKGTLYVSDTLGNRLTDYDLGLPMREYFWLSESEIVFHHVGYRTSKPPRYIYESLSLLNIAQKEYKILREYRRYYSKKVDSNYFDGPYESLEGNLYYDTKRERKDKSGSDPVIIMFPKNMMGKFPRPDKNHFLAKFNSGVYKISCDYADTVWMAPYPIDRDWWPIKINNDTSWYYSHALMYRFSDSSYVSLDSMCRARYPGMEYSMTFFFGSFNNKYPEVITNAAYEKSIGEGDIILLDVCIYNYETDELTMLFQDIFNIPRSKMAPLPSFSPDGNKIAFSYDGMVKIAYRGKK